MGKTDLLELIDEMHGLIHVLLSQNKEITEKNEALGEK